MGVRYQLAYGIGCDASPVKGDLDGIARISDRYAAVIGTAAYHQCAVHDYLVRLYRTGIDPVGIDGRGILLRRCQIKNCCIGHIPGQRCGSRSLCPVDIEEMGVGEIRGSADDLVDILFPVSRSGCGGEPAARSACTDIVARPTDVASRRYLGDDTGYQHLALAASRSEIESPVAGAGRTLGLYLQYILAVIGLGRFDHERYKMETEPRR